MSTHDEDMPEGWHTIKLVLLTEISTASNFHMCDRAACALFHARLVGERIARKCNYSEPESISAGQGVSDE